MVISLRFKLEFCICFYKFIIYFVNYKKNVFYGIYISAIIHVKLCLKFVISLLCPRTYDGLMKHGCN